MDRSGLTRNGRASILRTRMPHRDGPGLTRNGRVSILRTRMPDRDGSGLTRNGRVSILRTRMPHRCPSVSRDPPSPAGLLHAQPTALGRRRYEDENRPTRDAHHGPPPEASPDRVARRVTSIADRVVFGIDPCPLVCDGSRIGIL